MENIATLIKRKIRLTDDKQYADAHAYYHKNLYEKFTELSTKYEQELKDTEDALKYMNQFATEKQTTNETVKGTPLIKATENAIKTLQLYCKAHKKYGDCLDCKIRPYCHDYYIDSWDNIKK